ncbi:hypothetical protein GGQ88_001613 [Novosphingobium hassiacum]|uniref:Uncharacterized protein n=1 Tax=Novosphingobium hassiacum TaxID=173676 RepID=A0A7W5ZY55_9SPHN|nr:hypothetical protein [Novosphingobium hassiacum]MBB3860347.1 hypothetical protein [Novosphingobium hassiacum]
MMVQSIAKAAKVLTILAGAIVSLCAASPVFAQSCGINGTALAGSSVTYDPFSPSGLQSLDIPLTLTRVNGTGGKKTQEAYFILTKPAGSPAYTVQATVPNGSTFSNVLYDSNALPAQLPTISNIAQGQISVQFGGASQPDSLTINIRVSVPANVNLSAGGTIDFGIRYVCKGTGGLSDVLTPVDRPSGISININVLSALRASFVGTALDFGELAQVTAAQASTVKTSASNYVRVQSSGPYTVSLAVEGTDTNPYTLTPNATATNDTLQRIGYSLKFLGQTRSPSSTSPITQTCARAGVGDAVEDRLPLQGTLIDGGSNKTISPNYSEFLVVTITPQVAGFNAPTDCGSITL